MDSGTNQTSAHRKFSNLLLENTKKHVDSRVNFQRSRMMTVGLVRVSCAIIQKLINHRKLTFLALISFSIATEHFKPL